MGTDAHILGLQVLNDERAEGGQLAFPVDVEIAVCVAQVVTTRLAAT